ncbi:non-ribosomal peptide synthetase [Actinomyces sp. ZJ308]|uniref:non-ribosomal peptide synthetase n=1 Tax=Actinomyces sp. ZJ308 TaxID=2708342 RepID=UPI0014203FEB|nr:non-ribosomal peptide synthetase [Actinomyces sp. ZJ308]
MDTEELIEGLRLRGVVLWDNGDRLGYRAPRGVLDEQDLAALKSRKHEILEYLQSVGAVRHDAESRYEPFPMTDIQRAYNTGRNAGYELGGTGCHSYVELRTPRLDRARLETAWHALIQRHDLLSAVVVPPDMLRVVPFEEGPLLREHDLRGHDPQSPDEDYLSLRREMEDRTYSPGQWPLHEFRLLQFDECSIVQFSVDMTIADFVSVQVMVDELLALYAGRPLAPLPEVSFRDIVVSRTSRRASPAGRGEYDTARQYWLEAIDSLPGRPSLPIEHGAGEVSGPVRFTRRTWRCSPESWALLVARAKKYAVTPSSVLLTVYTDVLRRWSTSPDFCVNVTSMSRDDRVTGIERVVGDFTDVTVHASRAHPGPFIDRVRTTQHQVAEDLSHAAFPGMEVLREMSRARGESVVVPVVFTGALGTGRRRQEDGAAQLVYGVSRTPQVWIDCQALEDGGTCNVNWDVREGTIPPAILQDMWESLTQALDRLADDESVWQSDDVVRLGSRMQAVRARIRRTDTERPATTLHAGFWEQVQDRPDDVALVHGGRSYTYRQLAGHVQALDPLLSGVGEGDRVAVVLGKSVWQVAAVLAVLSRGATYVPIDHDQPAARQERMISACRPRLIITDAGHRAANGAPDVIDVDGLHPTTWTGPLPPPVPADAPAYIIFTSGSTGTPKGVVMTHAAAMNTIADVNERFGRSRPRTVLGVSRLSFDLSVYDIFGTLSSAGTLVLPTEAEVRDPSSWIELIRAAGVDTWNSVPALFEMLLEERRAQHLPPDLNLELILLSGDVIPRTLPARAVPVFPRAELISLGGATEAGIWSIYHVMTDHTGEENIPYGVPLSRQGVYVLDELLGECPDGVKGRIHICGDSLAVEYLNDPQTTEQKFFVSARQNRRLYDTGDIGSHRSDGVIEFHGRADNQVKINGYRVETGEIESVLRGHQDVEQAVVIAEGGNGRKTLRAFVTPVRKEASSAAEAAHAASGDSSPLVEALTRQWAVSPSPAGPDAATYAAWIQAANEASLAALLAAFTEAGLFTEPGTHHQGGDDGDIVARLHPAPELRGLVDRWLDILVFEGVLLRDERGLGVTRDSLERYRMKDSWDRFAALDGQVGNSPESFDYQRHAASTLLSQLRGEVNPIEILFPGGGTGTARAIYGGNRASVSINAAVSDALVSAVEARGDRPTRILEVGAGVGATTEHILPRLPDTVTEYRFTDISEFFLRRAKKTYRQYDFMTYGLFDINADCGPQDVEEGSYDVIVCANVLHNAINIDDAFARLNRLRSPGGIIVMMEPVTELYIALISIFIKLSLTEFTDVRAGGHKVFITDEQWRDVFARAGLKRIAEYPAAGDPLRECGQRLLVVGEGGARPIVEEELLDFLRDNLPGYMVPVSVKAVDAMPLSPQGKIDRRALAGTHSADPAPSTSATIVPRGELEERIAAVWRDVLDLEEVGRDQDFYALGGDSLLMAQTVTRMRQEVDALSGQSWDFIMREMLKRPTVADIASATRDAAPAQGDAPSEPARSERVHVYAIPDGSKRCRAVFHTGTGRLKDYERLVPALMDLDPHTAHVGFTGADSDEYLDSPTDSLMTERARLYAQDLVDLDMDSYELVGYCIGGFLAIETAKILTELGKHVERVVTISTHLCPHRIANELLCELAYGCILEMDPRNIGASFSLSQLHDALSHILDGVNRDIADDELCALDGDYTAIGAFFTDLSRMSPRRRRRLIYEAIEGIDADSDSARTMLEILYDVFRHSLRATIGYVPDVYLGKVLVLEPEHGVEGFYPSLGGDVDWPGTVLGELETATVSGSHATCLLEGNVESIVRYFDARR